MDIEPNWACQEPVGATITLLVREMRQRDITLNPLDSTVFLIGLYEDTGHLTYPSTTPEDARAAAYLLENKADLHVAGFFLNPPYEENQKEVLFEMMKRTEKLHINGLSVGFNIVRLERKVSNLSAIVDMYRKIVNVDALFVIVASGERFNNIIGRSGDENIDVGQLLTAFGGGGHAGAGSASVKASEMEPEGIRERLLTMLTALKRESISIADLMSFPVISVTPDTSMREVRELMAQEKIRGVMVADEEEIFGIIVVWDLKKVKKEKQWDAPVKAFMARNVITVGPGESPTVAARLMIDNDVGHLPVVQNDKMIGIVTRSDILTYFYDLLPESLQESSAEVVT
jgi:CBS domain-containing protein